MGLIAREEMMQCTRCSNVSFLDSMGVLTKMPLLRFVGCHFGTCHGLWSISIKGLFVCGERKWVGPAYRVKFLVFSRKIELILVGY